MYMNLINGNCLEEIRKGKFRYILDVLEWRNDNKVETKYEELVMKAVEFSKYVPKNNI